MVALGQGAAGAVLFRIAPGLALACAGFAVGQRRLGGARARGRRHVDADVGVLALRQIVAHVIADAAQLLQHLVVGGRQVHLQRALAVADRNFDLAQHGRLDADHRVLGVAVELHLKPLAERLLQRLAPLRRLALQRDGGGGRRGGLGRRVDAPCRRAALGAGRG